MPKTKGASAIKAAQETRWRLLVRNPKFLKEVEKLHKTHRNGGRVSEEQRHALGERWGIPRIPWEMILGFDSYKDEASRYALYDWYGLQHGPESWSPLNIYRVQRKRLAFLMVDLEYPIDDLAELFKAEVREYKRAYEINESSSRRRLDKISRCLQCWDLAQQGKTLGQIAKEVYRSDWRELPLKMTEGEAAEPTPGEIDQQAKELRRMGKCIDRWSFIQAKEDLLEEKKKHAIHNKTKQREKFLAALRVQGTLRQRVWQNIQSASVSIESVSQM